MTVPLPEYAVRRARPEDAAAYARTHVRTLRETYAQIMPEEFHRRYESTLDQITERHRARLEQEGSGRSLSSSWVAVDTAINGSAFLWILNDNPRAERFYRRNGFVPDGTSLLCGPSWYDKSMFRMVRR